MCLVEGILKEMHREGKKSCLSRIAMNNYLPSENGIILRQSKENQRNDADEQTKRNNRRRLIRPPKKSENLEKKMATTVRRYGFRRGKGFSWDDRLS